MIARGECYESTIPGTATLELLHSGLDNSKDSAVCSDVITCCMYSYDLDRAQEYAWETLGSTHDPRGT